VLPVFNALTGHPDYLPGAIESVIDQTHRNFELIIVDDGSTDDYVSVRE
jgi:glycosyltransferase involved in cell wall biosynthesis